MAVLPDLSFSDPDNISVADALEVIKVELTFDPASIKDDIISGATYNNLKLNNSIYFVFPINGNLNPCWNNIESLRSNALWVVTNRKIEGVNCILVKNAETAYRSFAKCYRNSFGVKVVGVTGSVGKTTTSAMIAEVLKTDRNTM